MLVAVLSGFAVAVSLLFSGRLVRGRLAYLLTLLPLSLFVYFIQLVPQIAGGNIISQQYAWIPGMQINFDFHADGLGLMFALLITGIGVLVFLYAASYLKGHPYLDRFFGYLSMFMASMLGLVLSDNVLTLFVFWELTSISSFFLIGFNNNDDESRNNSLIALAVTGGGGFFLMGAFVLMGQVAGTFSIQEMINADPFRDHPLYLLMILLFFGGAFTKSAQFPFHFWLPGAMKAPTPVSAYLHSATMVKAGIYLLARFTPALGDHVYWNTILVITGGVTMLYAAIHAILRLDLKAILAYSTISGLGMLVFLIGLGTHKAFIAAVVFILVHAFYKGGLFLTAGVIDHETGTRDISHLRGLRKVMAPLAVAGLLAALSNAGIPFTFGFLGKDLIYESTLDAGLHSWFFTMAAVGTNIFLLYAGFVTGIRPFSGELPGRYRRVKLPHFTLWMPPLLLGLGGLFFGLFPGLIDKSVVQPALLSMRSGLVYIPLKIWHGFNLVLLLSIITLAAGFLLYHFRKPLPERLEYITRYEFISPRHLVNRSAGVFLRFSTWYTNMMQNGYLRIYLLVIVSFLTVLLGYKLFTGVYIYIDQSQFYSLTAYELMVPGIMVVAILIACLTASRLTAVAALGVVGYSLCLLFMYYSAPDLAMTQFTIDTLTVVLFVLVLFKLPPFKNYPNIAVKIRDAVIGLIFGSLVSIIALEVLNETVEKNISAYYAENAYALARGKNIVNVILVDFRGIDTLVEITVLTIAAIGVFSLLKFKIAKEEFK